MGPCFPLGAAGGMKDMNSTLPWIISRQCVECKKGISDGFK